MGSYAKDPEAEVIDGIEMLYHITWPKGGSVKTLAKNFLRAVEWPFDVTVIFDRYEEGSIKTHERNRRSSNTVLAAFHLSEETLLSSRDIVMKSEHNKRELINVLCSTTTPATIKFVGENNPFSHHEEADCSII